MLTADRQVSPTDCDASPPNGPIIAVRGGFSQASGGTVVGEVAVSPCLTTVSAHRGRVTLTTADGTVVRSEEAGGFWSSGPLILDDEAGYLVVDVEGFGGDPTAHVVPFPTISADEGLDPFVSGLVLGILIPTVLGAIKAFFGWRRRYLTSLGVPLTELRHAMEANNDVETRRAYEALGSVVGLSGWAARVQRDTALLLGTRDPAERQRIAETLRKRIRRHSWKTR